MKKNYKIKKHKQLKLVGAIVALALNGFILGSMNNSGCTRKTSGVNMVLASEKNNKNRKNNAYRSNYRQNITINLSNISNLDDKDNEINTNSNNRQNLRNRGNNNDIWDRLIQLDDLDSNIHICDSGFGDKKKEDEVKKDEKIEQKDNNDTSSIFGNYTGNFSFLKHMHRGGIGSNELNITDNNFERKSKVARKPRVERKQENGLKERNNEDELKEKEKIEQKENSNVTYLPIYDYTGNFSFLGSKLGVFDSNELNRTDNNFERKSKVARKPRVERKQEDELKERNNEDELEEKEKIEQKENSNVTYLPIYDYTGSFSFLGSKLGVFESNDLNITDNNFERKSKVARKPRVERKQENELKERNNEDELEEKEKIEQKENSNVTYLPIYDYTGNFSFSGSKLGVFESNDLNITDNNFERKSKVARKPRVERKQENELKERNNEDELEEKEKIEQAKSIIIKKLFQKNNELEKENEQLVKKISENNKANLERRNVNIRNQQPVRNMNNKNIVSTPAPLANKITPTPMSTLTPKGNLGKSKDIDDFSKMIKNYGRKTKEKSEHLQNENIKYYDMQFYKFAKDNVNENELDEKYKSIIEKATILKEAISDYKIPKNITYNNEKTTNRTIKNVIKRFYEKHFRFQPIQYVDHHLNTMSNIVTYGKRIAKAKKIYDEEVGPGLKNYAREFNLDIDRLKEQEDKEYDQIFSNINRYVLSNHDKYKLERELKKSIDNLKKMENISKNSERALDDIEKIENELFDDSKNGQRAVHRDDLERRKIIKEIVNNFYENNKDKINKKGKIDDKLEIDDDVMEKLKLIREYDEMFEKAKNFYLEKFKERMKNKRAEFKEDVRFENRIKKIRNLAYINTREQEFLDNMTEWANSKISEAIFSYPKFKEDINKHIKYISQLKTKNLTDLNKLPRNKRDEIMKAVKDFKQYVFNYEIEDAQEMDGKKIANATKRCYMNRYSLFADWYFTHMKLYNGDKTKYKDKINKLYDESRNIIQETDILYQEDFPEIMKNYLSEKFKTAVDPEKYNLSYGLFAPIDYDVLK